MSSDEGYVHRPGATDAESDAAGATGAESEASPEATDDAFGARGWVLVGVLVLSLLVVPGVIYLYPAAPAAAGLPFFAAMLALPLVPALLLGLAAVWSMTAARRR